MSFTQTVARYSIKKLFSEKWYLLMFLAIPLMMGGLFSLISGPSGQPKPVGTLLITDNDDSTLSQLLVNGFKQGPMAEMFISKNVTSVQGEEIMTKGGASVWLQIEAGFAQNYLDEKPTRVKLVKNPSQNILPEIAETAVDLMADGGHYLQVLFAKELKQFNDLFNGEEISDIEMTAMSLQIKHTMENLEQQLFPPQIKAIKHEEKEQQKTSKSFMLLMFPGILFMSLLFSSQGMALEFWKDKSQGISSRLMTSPSALSHYLNGKILASLFVYVLIALVIGILGLTLLKISLSKLIIIVGWLMLSGLVLGSMMLFVCLLMPTEKSASVMTATMVFPLMMLGGSFFPFDAMPKWMVAIGQYLPNGYMLQSFNQWFIHDKPLSVLTTPAIIALVFIAIFWFINKSLLPQFART
ncbi:MAG TPA: ABC transporter permease [Oceanospirillales bacterium]|nr:ABC transporter permease [Oceanospirillales bacterium]